MQTWPGQTWQGHKVRTGAWLLTLLGAGLVAAAQAVMAQPATCARADFEAVVAGASDALKAITQKNSPSFQAKLRSLKEKRGWSHEQFMDEGARFVRDDKIAAFDEKSGALLARINAAGDGSGTATTPNCANLSDLRANMAALVEIQNEKWAYMFSNLDTELAK